jgi:hypothetical protein
MIGRLAWWAALLAIAAITTVLQIDRQSLSDPALAALVPAPLRSDAQTQIALVTIDADDPARALAEAERLVQRRPIPAEHLTLLAAAQSRAGQADAAAATIQIAGQRGWREPLAQEAVLRLALNAGDEAEAARRYAALFRRQETPNDLLIALGQEVLGEPGGTGRQTITDILVGAERWQTAFLERGPQVMPLDAFAEIAAEAMTKGTQFDCEVLIRTLEGVRQRDAAAARRMDAAAAQACP